MPLTYQPIETSPLRDVFVITLKMMHGDADSYSDAYIHINGHSHPDGTTEEKLIELIRGIEGLSDDFFNPSDLSEEEEEYMEMNCARQFMGVDIPIEKDIFSDGSYHASIESIEVVNYFDKDGREFVVSGWDE